MPFERLVTAIQIKYISLQIINMLVGIDVDEPFIFRGYQHIKLIGKVIEITQCPFKTKKLRTLFGMLHHMSEIAQSNENQN